MQKDQNQMLKDLGKYSIIMLLFVGALLVFIPKAEQAQEQAKIEREAEEQAAATEAAEQAAAERFAEYEATRAQYQRQRPMTNREIHEAYGQRLREQKRMRDQAELDASDPLHLVH